MAKRSLILSAFFILAAAYLASASAPEPILSRESLSAFPLRIGSWETRDATPLEPRVLEVLGVDDYANRVYATAGGAIGLYIGFYQSQREGSAIHSPMNCLPGAGWNPVDRRRVEIPVQTADGSTRKIEVNRITIEKGLQKQVVLYWYQSHARVVASEYWGKVYTVLDTIRMNRTDASLVRLVSPVQGSGPAAEAAAEESLVGFTQSLFPLLPRFLPE